MNKDEKASVLEFWLTKDRWVQFTRVMELCHRITGGPVGPADCLELVCRNYLERRGVHGATPREESGPRHLKPTLQRKTSRQNARRA